jgi:hypothetical protein
MPFFKEGVDRGEKIFNIVDSRLHDEHICELRKVSDLIYRVNMKI